LMTISFGRSFPVSRRGVALIEGASHCEVSGQVWKLGNGSGGNGVKMD